MLNTLKKPLKSRGTNKQPPSRSKTLMVGKYYTDLSGGFFGNCWSQLKRVTGYPAVYASRLFPRPPSKPGWSDHLTRWLLDMSLTPCVHVEVDEVEGGGQGHCLPLNGFSFPVLPLYQLLPEILPRFNLESERIWPDDPWPTSPIKPTLRAAPKTRVVSALWEAGLKSRQFPPGPPAAAGEIRDRRHGFLPTPLLHWGREKAHKSKQVLDLWKALGTSYVDFADQFSSWEPVLKKWGSVGRWGGGWRRRNTEEEEEKEALAI